MSWQTLRQLKGQSVQSYTQEFHMRALTLGISLDSPKTLLKYIGGLHSYLRHTILMFNPTSLDDVLVQATHLEARGKNVTTNVGKSSKPIESKNKGKKKLKWKERKTNTVKKDKPSCAHFKKEDKMRHTVGLCIQNENLRNSVVRGKRMLLLFSRTWDHIQAMKQQL